MKTIPLQAFATGLLVAVATSGGILEERVSEGSVRVAMFANLAVTGAAVVGLGVTLRSMDSMARIGDSEAGGAPGVRILLPQILGALFGIALVHAALRFGALAFAPWLSEQPAQLVNDGVAVFATLAVLWGCARGLDPRWLAFAFVVVTVYRATAIRWHVDRAPHPWGATVQELVVAQLVAVAIAVAVFRALARRGEG